MQLAEKHYKCIQMIIEGRKITDIAKELPSSRQAIYNWLEDVEFKAELDKERHEIKKRGQDKILGKLDIYVDEIHRLAMNSQSDNVKLNALEYIVDRILGKSTTKIEQTIEDKSNDNDVDIDSLIDDLDNEESNIIELDKVAK